jgi:DNA-binding response OmpR family regulator
MPTTILICDNEEPLRALVRATLAVRPYELLEAADGETAVALIRRRRPDLVLLDMMMPGLSGLDVLYRLRSDPETAGTPVIMLTARTQASDRSAAQAAGATYFLPKPFSPKELLSLVEEMLARSPHGVR